LTCSNDLAAWRIARAVVSPNFFADRCGARKISSPGAQARTIFSPSRVDAVFVNKPPDSVTLTWIESEDVSVQMSGQQELVLA
jgi:hypothetical protein